MVLFVITRLYFFQSKQVLPIPAISIWSVVALPNGDLAAGASDGKIWIFSADPARQADAEATEVTVLHTWF